MLKIKKIAHVAIAVEDLAVAKCFYQEVLGLEVLKEVKLEAKQNILCLLAAGSGTLELVAPDGPDSAVAKVLAVQGAGPFHIALEVEDVNVALSALKSQNIKLRDHEAIPSAVGCNIAFLETQAAAGNILFELCDTIKS